MATPVEDQLHAAHIAAEECRCRKLEASTGKPVKRRPVPKPWRRIDPQALLQDPEFLQHVTEFDYRLGDPAFQQYCRERGVFHVVPEEGSWRHRFFAKPLLGRDDFVNQCLMEGKAPYATQPDIETGWRIIQLGRAALQDAWELFLLLDGERSAAPGLAQPAKAKGSTAPRKAPPKAHARKQKPPTAKTPAKARHQLDLFGGGGKRRKSSR